MVPQTFDEWHFCITQKCKIELSKQYKIERLTILTDHNHHETKRMIELYGKSHLDNLISWYKKE